MLRALVVLAMLANWWLAISAWPELPERIPMHYDLAGNPDRWADRSLLGWFGVPLLGTVLGVLLGLLLPRWTVGMAARNSPWLNVPNKRAFVRLSEPARVRAVQPMVLGLVRIALLVQLLLGYLVYGGARIATGAWQSLPSWPSFAVLAALLACVVHLAVAGHRAVRRETAAGA